MTAQLCAAREAAASYPRMEITLAGKEYLAGQYSYADIAFYVAQLFGDRMGAPINNEHPRLVDWRARMSNRQQVRQVTEPTAIYLKSHGAAVPGWLREAFAWGRGQ